MWRRGEGPWKEPHIENWEGEEEMEKEAPKDRGTPETPSGAQAWSGWHLEVGGREPSRK